jgi:hypothetical protein
MKKKCLAHIIFLTYREREKERERERERGRDYEMIKR